MGSYNNMKLIFDHKNAANTSIKTDSVDTYCNVSMYGDSIIRVANFPVAKSQSISTIIKLSLMRLQRKAQETSHVNLWFFQTVQTK